MQLFAKSEQKLIYDSIDNLPIKIWVEIQETGDITKLEKRAKKKYSFAELLNYWEKINDEYLEAFGLSEEVEYSLQQKRLAAIEKANYIITGRRHHLTFAEVHQQNANFNNNKESNSDLGTNLARLTKYYGVMLKAEEITVREYYNFVREAKNGK